MLGTTAILGYGRFGRALAELLVDAGLPVRAWDPAAEVPADIRAASPTDLARGAMRVVLAVPVSAIREVAVQLKPHLTAQQLILDVASVKAAPIRALTEVLGRDIPWIATHPLFGPSSIALGERPLTVVICPNVLHPAAAGEAATFFETLGCVVVPQDAEAHDRLMAQTHALAFFVAKGLLDLGADALPFAPPSFQAMARTIEAVRSDASHLFYTIQVDNPFAEEARERLLSALEDIHRHLAASYSGEIAEGAALTIPDLGQRAPELREARELIDDTDRQLVRLLATRAQLARRAGRAKALEGRPIRDPARELEVLALRRRWAAAEGLDPESVAEIFQSIVRASRAVQRDVPREPAGPGVSPSQDAPRPTTPRDPAVRETEEP